jgi:hypothetical protein
MVWQNTLFLLVLLVLLQFLRRAPAKLRYVVSFIGLVKLIIPPFVHLPAASSDTGLAMVWQWQVAGLSFAAGLGPEGWAVLSLFLFWLAVLAVALGWLAWSTVGLFSLLKRGMPFQDPLLPATPQVEIRQSAAVALPWSLRFRRARIAVPMAWLHWPADCRRAILEHELAHIERRDTWAQLLQIVIQSIYFFHPLVWILNRQIYAFREMACDDRAIARSRIKPVQYATYLVDLGAGVAPVGLRWHTAAAWSRHSKRSLLHRIEYQVEEVRMKTLSKKVWLAVSALLVTLVVLFSIYSSSGAAAIRKTLLWQEEKLQPGKEIKDASFDKAPQILKRVDPKYPELARKAGIEGMVYVQMKINKAGRVESVSCVKTEYRARQDSTRMEKNQAKPQDPGLIDAALTAAKGWEFQPAEKNGKPVTVEVTMAFNFKLH